MSWAEDRAEAAENYLQSRVDAYQDHVYYGGSSREDAEETQFKLEVERLRALRGAHV